MNEGDFDKKISEKLKDDHTNYPNLDKNWQKVVRKLAETPPSKPTAGGLIVLPNDGGNQKSALVPWLLTGLLLLLGSNAWLVWHLYEAPNSPKSVILENKIAPQTPQTVRLYDTIIETKVIYKIDTIYKTVVVQETFGSPHNNSFKLNHKDNFSTNTTIPPSVFPSNPDIKQVQSNTTTGQTTDEKTNDKTATSHILQDSSNENKGSISQNHLPSSGTSAQSYTNTDSLNDNPHRVVLPKTDSLKIAVVPYDSLEMKPQQGLNESAIIKPSRKKLVINHYGIGLQGGMSWELPKLNGVDNGYWIGLANEIALNKHLRLSILADYTAFHYKALTRSTLHAIPNDPPMTENYNLKYIESTTPSVLAGLGVSYFLKPKSKINPFVSLQYSHRWVVPHTVEFEFTNKLTGDEKSFKVENYSHQDNWLLFGAGIETSLAPKVFGQFKAEYLYDPNHGNSSLKYLLLRGGVFYRF
jgi:hypothetical protein